MSASSLSWYVYILQCSDGTFYTGSSNNLEKRVLSHNTGRGAKYTRGRSPVLLLYSEKTIDKSAALKREIEIKKLSREGKKELVASSIEVAK